MSLWNRQSLISSFLGHVNISAPNHSALSFVPEIMVLWQKDKTVFLLFINNNNTVHPMFQNRFRSFWLLLRCRLLGITIRLTGGMFVVWFLRKLHALMPGISATSPASPAALFFSTSFHWVTFLSTRVTRSYGEHWVLSVFTINNHHFVCGF